jgi:hypothetical protein
VGGGVPGVDLRASFAIDHGDALPRGGKKIGGSQPCDPGANHEDIDVFITVELRETREGSGIDPIRLGSEVGFHGLS